MSGILIALAGISSKSGISVTANDVTRVEQGFTAFGTVTSVQVPSPTVVGGVAPFDYSWSFVSGSLAVSINDNSIANPQWEATVADGDEEIAVWELTVTDAQMNTATVAITVLLAWINIS